MNLLKKIILTISFIMALSVVTPSQEASAMEGLRIEDGTIYFTSTAQKGSTSSYRYRTVGFIATEQPSYGDPYDVPHTGVMWNQSVREVDNGDGTVTSYFEIPTSTVENAMSQAGLGTPTDGQTIYLNACYQIVPPGWSSPDTSKTYCTLNGISHPPGIYWSSASLDYFETTYDVKMTWDTPAPTSPTGISQVNESTTTVDVVWNASKYADYYYLYIDEDKNGSYEQVYWNYANDRTYTYTGLTPNNSYKVQIKAKNGDNQWSSATTSTIYTLPNTPAPSITPTSSTSLTASWPTPSYGADYYKVYLDDNFVGNTSSTSYSFSNLSPNTSYKVSVKACNENDNYCSNVGYTTKKTLPAKPTIQTTTPTNSTIQLDWSSTNGADSYNIYIDGTKVATTTSSDYKLTGLTANTTYSIGIEGVNSSGPSTRLTFNAQTKPNYPTNLSVTDMTQTSLTLNWDAPSYGTDQYKLYLNGNYKTTISSATGSYTFNNLAMGTTYTLSIEAVNESGTMGQVYIDEITIPPPPPNFRTNN